jgi:hypothetical protein
VLKIEIEKKGRKICSPSFVLAAVVEEEEEVCCVMTIHFLTVWLLFGCIIIINTQQYTSIHTLYGVVKCSGKEKKRREGRLTGKRVPFSLQGRQCNV